MSKCVRDEFLIFGAPLVGEAEISEVVDSLRSGWLGTGPKVARFEEMFREYVGSNFALALSSCTAGMHLSLVAAGIGPGDEVITCPMTFASTVNTIVHCGATPVLVDCERETGLIDPERIEAAVSPRTRAIMPVHLYGRPCNMGRIMEIAEKHNLVVIEDAAHAIEAVYKGRKVGTIGDLTCFSFYVTKNVMTGEGGMVTTSSQEFANRIKVYGLHGMTKDAWKRYSDEGYKHYQVICPGYKYNMMDLQAAIGLHQLQRVDGWRERRNAIWERYNEAFADLPVGLPAPAEVDTVHARHLYTLLIDRALELLRPHGMEVDPGPTREWLLRGQAASGGFRTAHGFGSQVSQREPGALPEFRDVLPVAGWTDKAFRYLAGTVRAGEKPGMEKPVAAYEVAAYQAAPTCEVGCTFRGERVRFLEDGETMEVRCDGGEVVYRWRKGEAWAEVAAPELWLK